MHVRRMWPSRGSKTHQLSLTSSLILVMLAATAQAIVVFSGRTRTAVARTGRRYSSGLSERGVRRLAWHRGDGSGVGIPAYMAGASRPRAGSTGPWNAASPIRLFRCRGAGQLRRYQVTLAAPLCPDQGTQNRQNDTSGFLRRIVADACSRAALADADATCASSQSPSMGRVRLRGATLEL
jgi:hypothetical protein